MRPLLASALFLAATTSAFAQEWQLGGSLGYGWYRGIRVNGPAAEAAAGIRNRFTAGAVVTEDLYEHLSGEIRYVYHDGDPYLSLAGRTGNMQGQSHSVTYDTLLHLRERGQRFRPFVAAGIGAKYYRATGPAPSPQPAPAVASLVQANQFTVLVSVGAGAIYRFPNHLFVRADIRDYITPVPRKIFAPTANASVRGLMHQVTPMIGLGFWF